MSATRVVRNDSGVGIGTADRDGEVHDHAGVHIGRVGTDATVVDFAGVRLGRVQDTDARETAAAAG